jgi:hypothetical protein
MTIAETVVQWIAAQPLWLDALLVCAVVMALADLKKV